jgi:multicomponent K+:H+ antiporter subunit G
VETTTAIAIGEAVVALLLVVGGAFTLIGAIGLLRFPDFFMRLHAPTKASTLGVGGVLVANLLWSWLHGAVGLQLLLITLVVFVTAPVSANLLAQAALHRRARSLAGLPDERTPAPPASSAPSAPSAPRAVGKATTVPTVPGAAGAADVPAAPGGQSGGGRSEPGG